MKLAQLEAFLAVVDGQSFSEAALELGLSQAAVSYAIAEFEKDLGVKLLERGRFGARLTPVGEAVVVHARAILQHQAAISQQASVNKGRIQGVLRVATFRSAAGKLLPQLMATMQKQYPDLSIQPIELDDRDDQGRSKEQLLRERKADIAFTENALANDAYEDLMLWDVMHDEYKAIVPQTDPRTVLSWEALESANFIFPSCLAFKDNLSTHVKHLDFMFQPSYQVREDSTILRMVSQELGISILPELAIDELPANVKVIPMSEKLERVIAVAILPGLLKTPAVRAFLHELKKQFPDSDIPAFDVPQALIAV